MILCKVLGPLVASEKHPAYEGCRLLWIQPIEGGEASLAFDTIGAGCRETVLVTREGGASTLALGNPDAPVDAAIVGIVDQAS